MITRLIHNIGIQNQNIARVFILRNTFETEEDYNQTLRATKLKVRDELGNTPYILQNSDDSIQTIINLHHLHAPNFERVQTEYNILMHAINRTSVFDIPS